MSYKIGIVTLGSTGNKTINLGTSSTPTALRLVVQNLAGTAESVKHVSIGQADGTNQRATSYFKDASGTSTFDATDRCISHYERIGGVVTEVLRAEFVAFTSTGVTLHVTTADVNYDVYITVDY
jgi:hypothetical protein